MRESPSYPEQGLLSKALRTTIVGLVLAGISSCAKDRTKNILNNFVSIEGKNSEFVLDLESLHEGDSLWAGKWYTVSIEDNEGEKRNIHLCIAPSIDGSIHLFAASIDKPDAMIDHVVDSAAVHTIFGDGKMQKPKFLPRMQIGKLNDIVFGATLFDQETEVVISLAQLKQAIKHLLSDGNVKIAVRGTMHTPFRTINCNGDVSIRRAGENEVFVSKQLQ